MSKVDFHKMDVTEKRVLEFTGVVTQLTFTAQQLRKMFFEWLDDQPIAISFRVLQHALAQMDDVLMPPELAHRHGFLEGCSIGHAARSVICLINSDGQEYRLATLIDFPNERASSEWWAKNWNNSSRVVIEHQENGFWSLQIA